MGEIVSVSIAVPYKQNLQLLLLGVQPGGRKQQTYDKM